VGIRAPLIATRNQPLSYLAYNIRRAPSSNIFFLSRIYLNICIYRDGFVWILVSDSLYMPLALNAELLRSATIRGGESLLLNPGCTLKITNIALGLHLPKPGSRTTLRFEQSAESASTTVLGTFLIGVVRVHFMPPLQYTKITPRRRVSRCRSSVLSFMHRKIIPLARLVQSKLQTPLRLQWHRSANFLKRFARCRLLHWYTFTLSITL